MIYITMGGYYMPISIAGIIAAIAGIALLVMIIWKITKKR